MSECRLDKNETVSSSFVLSHNRLEDLDRPLLLAVFSDPHSQAVNIQWDLFAALKSNDHEAGLKNHNVLQALRDSKLYTKFIHDISCITCEIDLRATLPILYSFP